MAQTFYRLTRIDGKAEWLKAKGEKIIMEGYTMFVFLETDESQNKMYYLIEEQSGLSWGNGTTMKEAKVRTEENLKKKSKVWIEEQIKDANERYGQSPMRRITYNPLYKA